MIIILIIIIWSNVQRKPSFARFCLAHQKIYGLTYLKMHLRWMENEKKVTYPNTELMDVTQTLERLSKVPKHVFYVKLSVCAFICMKLVCLDNVQSIWNTEFRWTVLSRCQRFRIKTIPIRIWPCYAKDDINHPRMNRSQQKKRISRMVQFVIYITFIYVFSIFFSTRFNPFMRFERRIEPKQIL